MRQRQRHNDFVELLPRTSITNTRRQRKRLARILRSFGKALAYVTVFMLVYALFMLVIIEWFSGCGEVIYYPDGTWKNGECVFIPYEPKSGTWK